MNVKKLSSIAKLPFRSSSGAAGYDLYSIEETHINPGERKLISIGLAIKVPDGTYGRIAPRSGISVRNGIMVGAGVIDNDYTGEIKVLLLNCGKDVFLINIHDRIAQLIIEKIETPEINLVSELEETERGKGGFGSTGK